MSRRHPLNLPAAERYRTPAQKDAVAKQLAANAVEIQRAIDEQLAEQRKADERGVPRDPAKYALKLLKLRQRQEDALRETLAKYEKD